MPEYRILAGTHRKADGERAEAGDTIEIPDDVASEFPNKFERVEPDENPHTEQNDQAQDGEAAVEPLSEVSHGLDEDVQDNAQSEDESDATPEGASSDDVGGVEAAGDVPDDYSLLSKMAKHYDGDEIHGAKSGDEIKNFLANLSDTEVAALKQQAKAELSDGDA